MLLLALVVLNHVSIIDVSRGVAEPDRAVEVEGTQIRAVLPAKGYRVPIDARVLDLPGRYLMHAGIRGDACSRAFPTAR